MHLLEGVREVLGRRRERNVKECEEPAECEEGEVEDERPVEREAEDVLRRKGGQHVMARTAKYVRRCSPLALYR